GDETPTAPPELIDAQVPGDAEEPRLERPIAAEGVPGRVELEEQLLRQVRRALGRLRPPTEELEDRTPVALNRSRTAALSPRACCRVSSSSAGSMHEIHCRLGAAPKALPPGPRAAPQLHPLRSVRRPGKSGAPRRWLSARPLLRSDKSQRLRFVLLDD